MCWYLWLVIIFYSLQKYFPFFSFLFSPSPLTLGFRDIWPDILLPLSVCLSVSLTHTLSQSLYPHAFPWSQTSSCRISAFVYNLQPTESFGLPQVVEVYFKDTTEKREEEPPGSEEAQQLTARLHKDLEHWLPRTPWGSPDAHLVLLYPPKWARAVLYSSYDSASLWLFLLHFGLLASLYCCLCFYFFLLSAFLSVLRAELGLIVWLLTQDKKSDLALCLIIQNGTSLLVRGPPDYLRVYRPIFCLAFSRA